MNTKRYPVLCIVTNSEYGKWYEVTNSKATLLEELIEKHDRYTDREGFFKSSATGLTIRSGAPEISDSVAEQHLQDHLRHVAERTKELWKPDFFAHLICAISDTEKNMLREEMARALPQQEIGIISGNYVHAPIDQIIGLVEKHFALPE